MRASWPSQPFIDTVVICTMTALVIVISDYGMYDQAGCSPAPKQGS